MIADFERMAGDLDREIVAEQEKAEARVEEKRRAEQAKRAADVLGEEIWRKFPFVKGMQPLTADLADLVLNRTWRPALSITS